MLTQVCAAGLLCLASWLIPLFERILIFFPICVLAFTYLESTLFLLPVLIFSLSISFPPASIRRTLTLSLLLGGIYLEFFYLSQRLLFKSSHLQVQTYR